MILIFYRVATFRNVEILYVLKELSPQGCSYDLALSRDGMDGGMTLMNCNS